MHVFVILLVIVSPCVYLLENIASDKEELKKEWCSYVSSGLTSDLQDGVVLACVLGVVSLQQTAARGGAWTSKLCHVQISKAQLWRSDTYRHGWHSLLFI